MPWTLIGQMEISLKKKKNLFNWEKFLGNAAKWNGDEKFNQSVTTINVGRNFVFLILIILKV